MFPQTHELRLENNRDSTALMFTTQTEEIELAGCVSVWVGVEVRVEVSVSVCAPKS